MSTGSVFELCRGDGQNAKGLLYSIINRSELYTFQLSCVKIRSANLCLTKSPNRPHMNWKTIRLAASLSSRIGPNHTSQRFINVKFVDSLTSPSSSVLMSRSRSLWSIFMTNCTGARNGFSNTATEGSMSPVLALKRGSRCLGQGIIWKSCGTEYRKLSACGKNSNQRVLLK